MAQSKLELVLHNPWEGWGSYMGKGVMNLCDFQYTGVPENGDFAILNHFQVPLLHEKFCLSLFFYFFPIKKSKPLLKEK